jgi:DNA-binding response OmpR family regulator
MRLESQGYEVISAADGEEALIRVQETTPDLVLLDVMMPKLDGIATLKRLKADPALPFVPVILLTAKADVKDVVAGLEAGADDYLTKPFGFAEFLARIRALLRRESITRSSVMRVGDLEVDTMARRVYRGGKEIPLSGREYALLEYLIYHAGQVVTRDLLMENVWSDTEIESNVIDVYVGYLRQKIDAPFDQPLIHTVRGVGYTLRAA